MKKFYYILTIMFLAAIILSAINMNFTKNLFTNDNFYQWLVICAGFCGILLSLLFARFQSLKDLIEKNDKKLFGGNK